MRSGDRFRVWSKDALPPPSAALLDLRNGLLEILTSTGLLVSQSEERRRGRLEKVVRKTRTVKAKLPRKDGLPTPAEQE